MPRAAATAAAATAAAAAAVPAIAANTAATQAAAARRVRGRRATGGPWRRRLPLPSTRWREATESGAEAAAAEAATAVALAEVADRPLELSLLGMHRRERTRGARSLSLRVVALTQQRLPPLLRHSRAHLQSPRAATS